VVTISGLHFGAVPCTHPGLLSLIRVQLAQPPAPATGPNSTATSGALGGTALASSWTVAQLREMAPGLALRSVDCPVVTWTAEAVQCVVPPGIDAQVLPCGPVHCSVDGVWGGLRRDGA
jgi:hypothetical protein